MSFKSIFKSLFRKKECSCHCMVEECIVDKEINKPTTEIKTEPTTIEKTLKAGNDVVLTGFGTFSVAKRAARMGRNPQTGATIKIAAKRVPKFKAGKGLKDAVK